MSNHHKEAFKLCGACAIGYPEGTMIIDKKSIEWWYANILLVGTILRENSLK